jgi:hypothetical protein
MQRAAYFLLFGLLSPVLFGADSPASAGNQTAAAAPASETETVLLTYQVQSGKEGDVAKILKADWAALQKYRLVQEKPHLVLRGEDDAGKTYFVEIFTWKSADAADHVPAEIGALWDQLQKLCETRSGRQGIDIQTVEPVGASG